jgi:hypothetical protein
MTCRRAALAAATTAAIGTAAAVAQPAPPGAPGPEAAQPQGPGGPGGPGGPPPWARFGHGGPRGDMMRGPMGPRGPLTGLVMRREDKAITAPEALKIAEGFLLWMGERDWKVANAVEKPEAIEFELQTRDGSRIASFAMDRKTGRVQRVG